MSNLREKRDLIIACFMLMILFLCAVWFFPIIPIDETRYASVAWEMWIKRSFVLPLLNGQPYYHKPPLFFWLIHLSWSVFGVNSITLRAVPFLFSLLNLYLTFKIAIKLGVKKQVAYQIPLILATMWMFLLWSFLILFDMILCFWVLLGILGILLSLDSKKGWFLLWFSLSLGGLTKGPVILVHLIPIVLFCYWWSKKRPPGWWFFVFLAVVGISFLTDLVWVLSAARKAGKFYEIQILWNQTAHRVVSSFAHKRPFWWYFPLLPLILAPWVYIIHNGWKKLSWDEKVVRFCLVWIGGPIFIFSFISGKQIHYLLPELPGFSILFAVAISRADHIKMHLVTALFLGVGIGLVMLPHFKFIPEIHSTFLWITVPLFLVVYSVLFVVVKFNTSKDLITLLGVSVFILMTCTIFSCKNLLSTFDLSRAARIVGSEVKKGKEVVFMGKYHGEFHFLGRISKEFFVARNSEALKKFLMTHPDSIIITEFKKKRLKRLAFRDDFLIYRQRIRGRVLMIWKREGFMKAVLGMD